MPLQDLTVDTNVLMHANNPEEQRYQSAVQFLSRLGASETRLCVDEGFHLIESQNRSYIGHEYITHLRIGTLGYATILQLAASGRISILTRTVPHGTRRLIQQMVRDRTDRVFAQVAFNSQEKTLVSHDFAAFPAELRPEFRKRLTVSIVDAAAAHERLGAAAPAGSPLQGPDPVG